MKALQYPCILLHIVYSKVELEITWGLERNAVKRQNLDRNYLRMEIKSY